MKQLNTIALVAGLLVMGAEAQAQAPQPPRPAPVVVPQEAPDAGETRQRLHEVFGHYPPSVREVLRIDPTLMSRPDYLATYPLLAAFLAQHPEVAHNPGYFVGEWRHEEMNNNPRLEAMRVLRDFSEAFGVALIAVTFITGLVLLVRTVVEHRRWGRASKLQADLNTKLIDRFASSEALLAYLQSPQGRQLTEPMAVPARAARAMDAPLNRIFWSLQAGAVLACTGVGMLVAARGLAADLGPEGATIFVTMGIIILTIGAGFLLSSGMAFLLSRRLGLVRPTALDDAAGS